jgi:hypothetical protein
MLGSKTVIRTLGPPVGMAAMRRLVPILAFLLAVFVGGQANAAILACSGAAKQCDECPADKHGNQPSNSNDSPGNLACVESCSIAAVVTPQIATSSNLTVQHSSLGEAPAGLEDRAFAFIENRRDLAASHKYHGSGSLQSFLCVFLN